MPLAFPFYRQRDAKDCGPACLMMVAASYGKVFSLPLLRERSHISRDGVSALGIMEAAESIGFRAVTVRIAYQSREKEQASLIDAPLPCIAHWKQRHFVVVYRASKKSVWIADPSAGKFRLSRGDFEKSWVSDSGKGIAILLEPTPEFYRQEAAEGSRAGQFSFLFGYVKPYRSLATQLFIGMGVGSLLQLIFPFLTQSVVDFGIDNRNINFIHVILAAQLMLFFSQMTVQFLQSRILLFVGTRINVAMVNDFLAKLMRLPIGYFDTKMTGDLMQRIGDQTRIESFLTNSALSVVFSSFNLVVFSAVLLAYNTLIFGVFCMSAALYLGWIVFFLRKRKEIDYLRFQQSGENNNAVIELIQGMQEIKLQGSERKRRQQWAGIQAKLFRINIHSLNLSQWQEAGAGLINQCKNIIISFIAAKAVIDNQMTLGMMLATQYMIGQLDLPLQQFITFIRAAQDAKISLERLGEVQQQPDEDNAAAVQEDAAPDSADIRLEQVSFRYNHLHDNVLSDIDLHIPRGKVTAIVGASGSGKTTLLKLLMGFYQPTSGHIRVGHLPLWQIRPATWRLRCGAVTQDGFIFSDTIANNITESDEYPDRGRMIRAVEIANIREFIETLPLGYNTTIGSRGNGISQGQKQRLLIARAVYKNPDFLFFDEATNALDANNERAIVENLEQFYRYTSPSGGEHRTAKRHNGAGAGNHIPPAAVEDAPAAKTVVIVAHRLSTVRNADQIVVLDRGRIIETGTHEELARLRGAYYHLVKNQLELGD